MTSGYPSQNVDLGSLSFPRRLGVRFDPDYVERHHLKGLQVKWSAYEDSSFTKDLGKDFYHEDMINMVGWANYYFDGKFKTDVGYIKLEIINPTSSMLVKSFYFRFRKNYLMTLDGRKYLKHPILEEKVVKNGVLEELKPKRDKKGNVKYVPEKTMFKSDKVINISYNPEKVETQKDAIIMTKANYTDKAKMVFLVTPPHLMGYAKLLLILIKQLVDLNFDSSYMTKKNQKPWGF